MPKFLPYALTTTILFALILGKLFLQTAGQLSNKSYPFQSLFPEENKKFICFFLYLSVFSFTGFLLILVFGAHINTLKRAMISIGIASFLAPLGTAWARKNLGPQISLL